MRRVVFTVVAASLLPGTLAAPAGAKTYGISVDGNGFVSRLGSLRPHRAPYVRNARAAFGRPTRVRPVRGACKVRWSRLKLDATFTSFGGISDFCRDGRFQSAVVRSSVWRTWKGLRVGMRSTRVRQLHTSARFTRGKWVLASQTVYGPEPSPTVSALVRNGRVTGFSLWVGGAGD